MKRARPYCSDLSRDNSEPLFATASRIDRWLLVEYRGLWGRDLLPGSGLSDQVKRRLRDLVAAVPRTRLLFIRRPDRRRSPEFYAFVANSTEVGASLHGRALDAHEDLLDLELEAEPARAHALFLVCTHGKRDPCCALRGRPVYEALADEVEPQSLWQCTHVGGDRFAGNLLVLPEGLYFGRVERPDADRVLASYLEGRIELDLYRGRCCFPFAVQAAEQEIRSALGLDRIDAVRFAGVEAIGERVWRVRFRVEENGEVHEVEIAESRGDLTYLTCGADSLARPRLFEARAHSVLPAAS
jgi:hypothetical protein